VGLVEFWKKRHRVADDSETLALARSSALAAALRGRLIYAGWLEPARISHGGDWQNLQISFESFEPLKFLPLRHFLFHF
jgi:hypothetical protein